MGRNNQRRFVVRVMSRTEFLKEISLLLGATLAGCSPVRILLHDYPSRYDAAGRMRESILSAFVLSVVPGADTSDPNLVRVFSDDFYPFAAYCGYFTADLDGRSVARNGVPFTDQTPALRTALIEEGLEADGTTARLYRGAILLAQVSIYGGIYDDDRGCPLIDFHGRDTWQEAAPERTPDITLHLAHESTTNGNYA